MGRSFGSLIEFWLRDYEQLEIVAQQKQIFLGTGTLGEIDFLYQIPQQQLIHLETAIKFYLHFPEEHTSGSHFIRPNSSDHFEGKINKLLGEQLPRGSEQFPEIKSAEAFIKGELFTILQQPDLSLALNIWNCRI